MRTKIVAGNWKMNKNCEETEDLLNELIEKLPIDKEVQIVVAPTFVNLASAVDHLEFTNITVAAQNLHQAESGAYTGEISADMLKSVGVNTVILGHSERREYFAESNEQLALKVDAALANGITPIFCCGESLSLREGGDFLAYVADQLTASLFHLSAEEFGKVVIAYEPIWAIGTGLTASAGQAQEMHAHLRVHIAAKYGATVADDCSILYGGSCNAKNAQEIFAGPDVDGGLIGGASLIAADFITIAKSF